MISRAAHLLGLLAIGLAMAVPGAPARAQDQGDRAGTDATELLEDAQRRDAPLLQNEAVPRDDAANVPVKVQGDPDAAIDAADSTVRIGSVLIEGADDIDRGRFAEAIEAVVGQPASPDTLAGLTSQIAEIARAEGMVFASAYIPEQAVRLGIVRVRIDDGRIDEVRLVGTQNRAVRRTLEVLVGAAPDEAMVERQLLLAHDIPEVRLRNVRFLREDSRRVLEVTLEKITRRNRFEVDNYGTDSFGPVRARLTFQTAGLLDDSDIASFTVRGTPAEPSEIIAISATYSTAINSAGTRIGLVGSITENEPGGRREGTGTDGDSQYLSVYAQHPLLRTRDASVWVNASAAYLSIEQDVSGVLVQLDNQVTLSAGITGRFRLLGGALGTGAQFTQGVDLFDATRQGDPLASRLDGDGVFTKANFWFDWTGTLSGPISLRVAANGQLASRPLLAAQEFTLGGPYLLRGYDFSERQGDEGIAGLVELRGNIANVADWVKWLQLYGFVDAGHVTNRRNGFGGGTLVSAGGGVRAGLGPFDLGAEAAFPINEPRFEAGDKAPQVNLQLGIDF